MLIEDDGHCSPAYMEAGTVCWRKYKTNRLSGQEKGDKKQPPVKGIYRQIVINAMCNTPENKWSVINVAKQELTLLLSGCPVV